MKIKLFITAAQMKLNWLSMLFSLKLSTHTEKIRNFIELVNLSRSKYKIVSPEICQNVVRR